MSRSTAISLARFFCIPLIFALLCGISSAQDPKAKAKAAPTTKLTTKAKGPVYASPEEAEKDPQFALQGEYKGEVTIDGKPQTAGVQVIARGKEKYHAVLYYGGLPGDGWKEGDNKEEADETEITNSVPGTEKPAEKTEKLSGAKKGDGTIVTGELAIKSYDRHFQFKKINARFSAPPTGPVLLKDAVLHVKSGNHISYLKHVARTSPTLGLKPPKDAIVLFDGSSTAAFQDGTTMTDDKLLMPEAITKQKFQSFTLHAEFRTPFQPEDGNEPKSAQHRGNSGIYLQNRYEIQILDSFGLEPKNDYCGGFYKFHIPKLNMCLPPLTWQTYDIDFTAAQYENGKKVKNARLTAKLNGVVIHDDIELVQETAGSLLKEGPEPGGLLFQQHGNPVRFKNIWIVEKK